MRSFLLSLLLPALAAAQGLWLTPADFGFPPLPHGLWDYAHPPANVLAGSCNGDVYPDVVRFDGCRLEVYYARAQGFPARPDAQQTFLQPITDIAFEGEIWSHLRPLKMTLADGSAELIPVTSSGLALREDGFPLPATRTRPPRQVSEADFHLVWESPSYPSGFFSCAVGDVDGDGVTELATYWKMGPYSDTAWMLIYKNTGNDAYALYLEDTIWVEHGVQPSASQMAITDMDEDGQKELLYTYDKCYFWEFSAPGVFTRWNSNIEFPFYVASCFISDVDQDSIPEIAALCEMCDQNPPCYYLVKEFQAQDTLTHTFQFSTITYFSQTRWDCRMAVGDFDNDGATDLVSGNIFVWTFDPIDVQYFRYDPTCPNPPNFRRYWLHTGVPASCVTPVVADFDADGANELFTLGAKYHGPASAYVWEATGLQSGYVAWWDTVSSTAGNINEVTFGWVDGLASVAEVKIQLTVPTATILSLWRHQNGGYAHAWQSPVVDSCF
jgi:hypothetical protein